MNFKDLELKISYQSGNDNILNDFYNNCLQYSTLYQRAVAYFTSSSLSTAAHGIAQLIYNNGKMEFIVSPNLLEEDIKFIKKGILSIEDAVIKNSKEDFSSIKNRLVEERLEALSWLISTNKINIKIALAVDEFGGLTTGIYHEKIGIFTDDFNNKIAFQGSGNESNSALDSNWESHRVFWSWDDYRKQDQQDISNQFNLLWLNKVSKLKIIDFKEATEEVLKPYKRSNPPKIPNSGKKISNASKEPLIPDYLIPYDHQKQAIKNWFKNDGRGLLKMATGSGKTITALIAATKLHLKVKLNTIIILCPYKHLVDQWYDNAKQFNYNPILAYENKKNWYEDLNATLLSSNKLLFLITTNKTFSSEIFQNKIDFISQKKTLLIADEVHNIGTENNFNSLPKGARFRLGLSATPERWFDDEGTKRINNYFGKTLKPEFTLKEAIESKTLCNYRYYPILIELTDSENHQYREISKSINKLYLYKNKDSENYEQQLSRLLIKRASILGSAYNKLEALENLMLTKRNTYNWIFYCGDRDVECKNGEDIDKQISLVTKLLGKKLGFKVENFIAETSRQERRDIIRKLTNKKLQGLVAIRCLDEGVDIPSTDKIVILASSTNPKQFIQRRGRVLRKDKNNKNKIAEIYDMITIPPVDQKISEIERVLVKKEIKRFDEFASLAINHGEARGALLDLKTKYNLLDY